MEYWIEIFKNFKNRFLEMQDMKTFRRKIKDTSRNQQKERIERNSREQGEEIRKRKEKKKKIPKEEQKKE